MTPVTPQIQRSSLSRVATLLAALAASSPLNPTATHAQVWSPDGQWITFIHACSPEQPIAPNHTLQWLVGGATEPKAGTPPSRRVERLWSVRPATSDAVLLDEVEGQLTEASWARNGSALVFGRLVMSEAKPRFELVYQDEVDRKRVVRAWTWDKQTPSLDDHSRREVALSPDAKFAVAPMLAPPGLILLNVADGNVVAEFPGGTRPAWSDDGRLAFIQAGTPAKLLIVPRPGENPAAFTDIDADTAELPDVRWSRDGQSVRFLTRQRPDAIQLETRKVSAPAPGEVATANPAPIDVGRFGLPATPKSKTPRVEWGFDHDESQLFLNTSDPAAGAVLTWMRVRMGDVYKRYHPLSESIPLSGLAVLPRPNTIMLAIRAGSSDNQTPPLLTDPERESAIPIVPDQLARRAWIDFTLSAITNQIANALPNQTGVDPRDLRPTRLPMPGELEPNDPRALRLKRLALFGRAVITAELPLTASATNSHNTQDRWARFIFAALAGDHQAALRQLDSLETRVEDPDARLRLLGLRAQILLDAKQLDAALPMIQYLEERAAELPPHLVVLPGGVPAVIGRDQPKMPWVAHLAASRDQSIAPSNEDDPFAKPGSAGIRFPRIGTRPAPDGAPAQPNPAEK